jgi:hypothetical protein
VQPERGYYGKKEGTPQGGEKQRLIFGAHRGWLKAASFEKHARQRFPDSPDSACRIHLNCSMLVEADFNIGYDIANPPNLPNHSSHPTCGD